MFKHIFYLLLFCLLCIPAYSQVQRVELSHYMFPQFTKGTILMKTEVKDEALLNYNSLTEEMVFDVKGEKLAIDKDKLALVDTIFINGRKFVPVNNKFVEFIYHSTFDLFCEHVCTVTPPAKPSPFGGSSQTSNATLISSFESSGVFYGLKLPDGYIINTHIYYWIKKDGKFNRAVNMRQLTKYYEAKEDLLKAYVKEHDVKFDNLESIVQLFNYLDTKQP